MVKVLDQKKHPGKQKFIKKINVTNINLQLNLGSQIKVYDR